MGKYSDPGVAMAVAGTEASYPLVAIAIDNHNKTSQNALKWAIETGLIKRGQTLVLVHVNTKGISTGQVDASGFKQADPQLRELFLPYRCFCTRKDVNCKDVVIDDTDVVKAIIEFIAQASIEIMVMGSSSKGMLRRFKNSDVPLSVSKGAPDFCTVYIIGKEKVSSVRNAIRAAPTMSPLRPQMSNPSAPKPAVTSATNPSKWTAAKDHHVSESALILDNSIKSPFQRENSNCSSRKSYGDFSSAFPDSTDISYVSSGRPSVDRYGFQPRLSSGSEINLELSFEMMRTPNRFSNSNQYSNFSQSSTGSSSSQNMDDVESEIRRLRMELKQTMDMYSTACKEALHAKKKLTELEKCKIDEQQKLYEARTHEEAAMQMIEDEKEKARAALEAAEKSNRIAELEAKKRLSAEMLALKEAEEKKKMMMESMNNLRYRKYSIDEIELATENFNVNRKIGEGGYGPVFKGYLDHTQVAIKVLRPDAAQGRSQFQQEVEVLSCIRHPNMVILMGACPEYGCLVYEYMANGSLDDCLFRHGGTPPIPWQHRFRIAAEVATALLFLHQTKPEPLVHRDLKPANILLDGNYVSKIADVGLARLVPPSVADTVTQYLMTSTAGTFCYIDPEYQQSGMLGVKSDVYSLGVLLLQLLTAKSPMGLTHSVSRAIENGKFAEVLDPEVHDWPVEAAQRFAQISLQCAELRRKDRPDLATVVLPELHQLRLLGEENLRSSRR